MSCNPVRLQDFVYGFLDDAERAEIEEHVVDCDACRARLETLTGEKNLLSEAGRKALEHTAARPARPAPRLWGMLSVAASLVACAAVIWSIQRWAVEPGAPLPAQPGRSEEAKIRDLVSMLGSESLIDRDSAQAGLADVGEPAVPFLRQARQSEDPEIRARAAVILRDIAGRLLKLEIPADRKTFAPDETFRMAVTFRNTGKLPIVIFKRDFFILKTPSETQNVRIDEMICYEMRAADSAGNPFPGGGRQTLVFTRNAPSPRYTCEIAEEDFLILKGGESAELTSLTFRPWKPGVGNVEVAAPHRAGRYRANARYRFAPEGKPDSVTFTFRGKAQELWQEAFRGELTAPEVEFEVSEVLKK